MTADDIAKAIDWLINTADKAAQARADRIHLEEFTKHLKANLKVQYKELNPGAADNAQETFALSHPNYKSHLEGLKEAIKQDERFRWLKDTAMAKVDVWRTSESTKRALKI